MVLVDPVSRQIPHGAQPGRATCRAAPRPCRADADHLGSNRVHRFCVPPCVRYDGSAAGFVQLGRKVEAGSVRQALWEGRNIVRVHVVAPEGFDNPGQPTGGNIYDLRVCAGLAEAGWDVVVTTVAGAWPVPGSGARDDLARIVSAIPDGETVLIDGLIASAAAAQLLPHAGRIRMTVLLHMPLATALDIRPDASAKRSERAVLRAATGVVVPSEWTRQQVLTRYAVPADRVHVARPGVDRVAAPARPVRGHLICVGVLGHHKGQDLLVEALADLAERDWHCVLAGPLNRDPDFVEQLQTRITRLGYGHRVRLTGVLTGAALSHAYTTADLLVAPSRSETYGMTVTEALAHGLPVIAAAVGGLPEALGSTAD